jgi:DNA polymerase-1
MTQQQKKVLILDGYNLLYRARYSGMNKGDFSTIFNFFRSLRPLIEKFNPDTAYFVLEGMPKKRLELLSEYKGQREYHNKDNFSQQRRDIIEILWEFFPISLVKHPDYECDDVAAHLAKEHDDGNTEVTIVSSDTDFMQLISDTVKVYNPVKKDYVEGTEYDYVMWKALRGDAADNIEGFAGIGDKRAKAIVENEEKLEDFLNKDDNRTKFEMNLNLISFHDLVEDNEVENIKFFQTPFAPKWDNLKQLFKDKYNFNSMVKTDKSWNNYINTFDKLFRSL